MDTELTPYKVDPTCEPTPAGSRFALGGVVGDWLDTVVENWLLPFPRANPAMTQMFRDRDRRPVRKLLQWSGEFAGKYLLGALHVWELTGDERLRQTIQGMIEELVTAQGPDGYLGPFPPEARLTGDNWDLWGHYHTAFALLRHYALTGEERSLEAAVRAADLLCATFGPGRARILHQQQMNMGLVHGLALLYRYVPKPEYLATARWIVEDSDIPGGVQFMRAARQGKELFEFGNIANRWEILHFTQGLVELYWLTGATEYRDTFLRVWDSIRRLDRHNTGGFSTGERAVGTPYMLPGEDKPNWPNIWQRCIETCCTVAWNALSVDMLRLSGDSTVADEIELTLYNSAQGSMHPSGRAWTYNTPMRGWRLSSADQISAHAHPGGPELNCCNANAPRPLGMIRDWALMTSAEGLTLNHYGAGVLEAPLADGGQVRLEQETEYPLEGAILLRVTPDQPRKFTLRLRIPSWSRETKVEVTGEPSTGETPVPPGAYLSLRRQWQAGDTVEISLDFSPRYWAGREECAGMVALYRGPLLLAWDQRFTEFDEADLPAVDASALRLERIESDGPGPRPLLLVRVGKGPLVLCDFASAGGAGNPYTSWLPAVNADPECEGPFARSE